MTDRWELPLQRENDFVLLTDGDGQYTYNECMKKAVSIGEKFLNKGMINQPVGIWAEHSKDTVIAMLGILLSGNYYVPVSKEASASFIRQVKEQTNMTEWLEHPAEEIRELSQKEMKDLYDRLKKNRECVTKDSPLYVIFTSGSTGTPKGIVKTHANMCDFLQAYVKEFHFDKNTVLGNQAPFYFDASAKDIYVALYVKCRMVILDSGLFVNPKALVTYMNEQKINTIQWVPSALSILSMVGTFRLMKPKYLKRIFFVGEKFPIKQLRIWMRELPEAEFVNLYGASEMAGICVFCRLDKEEMMEREEIPMGIPLSNSEVFLWDEKSEHIVTEKGKKGELCVKSKALAAGYLAAKEGDITFEVQKDNRVCYHSGDLAYYDGMGRLIFAGRNDFQIKHMGHRIELEEIEGAVLKHTRAEDVCCVYHKNKIQLFVCGSVDKGEMTKELKEHLPPYMLPNKIVVLDKIPKNKNGKKNRQKLMELAESGRRHGRDKGNHSRNADRTT